MKFSAYNSRVMMIYRCAHHSQEVLNRSVARVGVVPEFAFHPMERDPDVPFFFIPELPTMWSVKLS